MFNVTWSQPAEYPKGAILHSNGYWYTDTSYTIFAQAIRGGLTYAGAGETIEEALANLRSKIEAGLSKNRDKPVLKALADFDSATK